MFTAVDRSIVKHGEETCDGTVGSVADTLGAVAGVAFRVLLFVSVAAVDPQRGVSDQALQTWWADAGHRDGFVLSMYTLLLASPLFLVFLTRLRSRLRTADAAGWNDLIHASGIVAAAALGLCAVLRGVVAGSMRFADEPLPGVDTLRFATDLAFSAWNLVMLFIAVVIAVASILTLSTRALPRWLGWLGVPIAVVVAALFALEMAPFAIPLVHVWVIASCVCLWRSPAAAPAWTPELAGARLS